MIRYTTLLTEKDQRLTPITDLIQKLEQEVSDAEWDLDFTTADRLYEELGYYRKLLKDGVLYVPNF
jgi:hypothetical protein